MAAALKAAFWDRTDLASPEARSAWRAALEASQRPSLERPGLLEAAAVKVQRGIWPEAELTELGPLGPSDFLEPIGADSNRGAMWAKVRTEGAPWLRCLLEFGFGGKASWLAQDGKMTALLEEGFRAVEAGGYPVRLLPGLLPWRVAGLAGAEKLFELAERSGASAEFLNSEDSEGRTIEEAWLLEPRGSAEAGTLEGRLRRAVGLGWDPNRDAAMEFGKNALWSAARGLYSAEALVALVAVGADPSRPLRRSGADAEWLDPAPKSNFGGALAAALDSNPKGPRTMALAEAAAILAKQGWAPPGARECAEILRAWEERSEIEAGLGIRGGRSGKAPRI